MVFAAPIYLVALAILLPLGTLTVWRQERRRQAELQAFGDVAVLARASALRDAQRGLLRAGLTLSAVAFSLIALARPQVGSRIAVLSGSGRDVVLVLDLSRSMKAEDVAPSRLEAAKQAARALAAALPGDRIGLVVFSGAAFLDLAPTLDRSVLGLFLDAASPEDMPDQGTDLGVGLAAAAAVLEPATAATSRAVVLLSDGENLEGEPDSTLAGLKRRRIPVFAVGVGTAAGSPIPVREQGRPPRYYRDESGRVVVTRLNEPELHDLASGTGGGYVRWDGAASVRSVVAGMSVLAKRPIASRATEVLTDRFQWPLAAALLGLVLESLLPERRRKGWR